MVSLSNGSREKDQGPSYGVVLRGIGMGKEWARTVGSRAATGHSQGITGGVITRSSPLLCAIINLKFLGTCKAELYQVAGVLLY